VGLHRISLFQTWPYLGTQIWTEPVLGRTCLQITELPDETNGINSAVCCYKEAVQFSASFIMSLFDKACGMAMNFTFSSG